VNGYQKLKIGSCESGEWFFVCAFLFATSPSYEGGEKRTTAKNKAPDLITVIVTIHSFYRLLSFAPSGLKMFACFVAQGVALG